MRRSVNRLEATFGGVRGLGEGEGGSAMSRTTAVAAGLGWKNCGSFRNPKRGRPSLENCRMNCVAAAAVVVRQRRSLGWFVLLAKRRTCQWYCCEGKRRCDADNYSVGYDDHFRDW